MKMNAPGAPPSHRLPVLTEVVRLTDGDGADDAATGASLAIEVLPSEHLAAPRPEPVAAPHPEPVAAPRPEPVDAPRSVETLRAAVDVVPSPERPAVKDTVGANGAPTATDGPAPPEWLKRRPAHVHVGLPLPAMAPPSPLPPDFSGSWWSRDEGPAIVSSPVPVPVPMPAPVPAPVRMVSEDVLVQRVLDGLGGQIDLMFDHRMREALVPSLARAADLLVEDLKVELHRTLREMVSRAVAVELARERQRREDS